MPMAGPDPGLVCKDCHQQKPRDCYSGTQKKYVKPSCRDCVLSKQRQQQAHAQERRANGYVRCDGFCCIFFPNVLCITGRANGGAAERRTQDEEVARRTRSLRGDVIHRWYFSTSCNLVCILGRLGWDVKSRRSARR